MKTITLPVYKRADYLTQTLDALKTNRIEGYTLYVAVDPGSEEVAEVVRAIDFMPKKVLWHTERQGLNGNIRSALFAAMDDRSEFNVAIEDDVVLMPDALDLAEWFYRYEKRSEYVALVFCNFEGTGNPTALIPTRRFWSWGYCFHREGWEKAFVKGWDYVREAMVTQDKKGTNWDTHMMRWIMIGMHATLLPDLSRSTHIGEVGGTHFMEHSGSKHFERFFKGLPLSDGSVRDGFTVEGEIKDYPRDMFEKHMLGRWK